MCANDDPPALYQPLLNRLFDSEAGSDVIFLVGPEPETWRFPGHRSVLCNANPVFKAMLGNLQETDQEHTVTILDVDGRAFDLLLRFLYKEDVHIQSVQTALATLYAAQKYLCISLMRQCILFLDGALSIQNALQIYEHLRVHSGQRIKSSPSAPPYEVVFADIHPEDDFSGMLRLLDSLLFNTLLFIDLNAEEILGQESVEDLTVDSLREILDRDSLDVRETLVYTTIERWSNRECKRCHLELSPDNRRSVLGEELVFSVRYLLMGEDEFCSGPMYGALLTKEETMTLFAYIRNLPVTNTCSTLTDELIRKMKTRRRRPKDCRIIIGKKNSLWNDKKGTTVKKSKKKKKTKEGGCTGSCVADCIVRALACIFD